jgi:hypothetical protein
MPHAERHDQVQIYSEEVGRSADCIALVLVPVLAQVPVPVQSCGSSSSDLLLLQFVVSDGVSAGGWGLMWLACS